MTSSAPTPSPAARGAARAGAGMALASMICVQVGIALSVGLFDDIGTDGAAGLRLAWAGLLFLVIVRPGRSAFSRRGLIGSVALGAVTAGVTLCFTAAVARLPLGTASALEFLGPLGVAIVRGRGATKLWPAVAAAGVLLLTEPWQGTVDAVGVAFALAAAGFWAAYIVLTQLVGDEVSGTKGLAVSMPVAGLIATAVAAPSLAAGLTPEILLAGLGLAVLLPVVPFTLELLALRRLTMTAFGTLMSLEPAIATIVGVVALAQAPGLLPVIPFTLELLALRRLTTAAFGTLMSLEPAIALLVGLVLLSQTPGLIPVAGILFVVAAGIGAERTGTRADSPPPTVAADAAALATQGAR